jgi:hypothetical protein
MLSVMELLTCPNCGCRVQATEAILGRPLRCFGCEQMFVAATQSPAAPRNPAPKRGDDEELEVNGEGGPFCPGCGRRVTWSDLKCRHCGEELEAEDERSTRRENLSFVRRDCEPHRAALIVTLGNVSAIVGALGLCTFGFAAAISVPLGALAVAMANRDLEKMREGRMDPAGKSPTQTGRVGGVAGILCGLLFAAIFALVYLAG